MHRGQGKHLSAYDEALRASRTVSKEEQDRRMEEIHKHEAGSSSSHRESKANLNAHKFYGTGR